MARSETFEAKVYLNQKEAQDAMAELEAQIVDTGAALKKFNEEKNSKKSIEAEQHLKRLRKQYEEAKHGVENYRKAMDDLSGQSMSQLMKMQKRLRDEMAKTKPDAEGWRRLQGDYQKVTQRVEDLRKAQKGIVTEGQKSTNAFKTLFGKVNEFYGGLLVYSKAAKAAFQAIIGVTKQVVNASQTMGDKWNNGMAAMKTTTDAFFMALSTGDWSAFNDGLLTALKNARELAELKDLLGSFQIAGGYMQAKYRTDFTSQMTEATNTENDAATRKAALDAAKADLEAQREFTERDAQATFETLQAMFESFKGIAFSSQEEFDSFFDRLFRYTTTGADEAVNEINRLKGELEGTKKLVNMAAWGGVVPDELYDRLSEAQNAYNAAIANATDETLKLVAAADINDEKHKKLIQTYGKWRGDLQRIDQDEKTYNRTRDRVIKQIGEAQKAVVEEDYLKQRMATAEKYGRDTDTFMNQLLDRQIARMEKAKAMLKEEADEMARYYEGLRTEDGGRFDSPLPPSERGIADQGAYEAFQEKIWAKAAEIREAIAEDSALKEYETKTPLTLRSGQPPSIPTNHPVSSI